MSLIETTGTAPSFISLFVPRLIPLSILPGTAYTHLPCSAASSAVMREPLLKPASTTTVAAESPLIMRLRLGNVYFDAGYPFGYSLMTRPLLLILSRALFLLSPVSISMPQPSTAIVPPAVLIAPL